MTMTIHAQFHQGAQLKIDHTPVSALAAGDIVHLGNGLIGIANRAIAAAEQDALDISPNAVYKVKKAVGTGVVFAQGDEVFWDTVAETTVVDSNANTVRFGQAVQASVTGDDHVKACPNRHELGEEGAAIAAGAAHVADPASAAAITAIAPVALTYAAPAAITAVAAALTATDPAAMTAPAAGAGSGADATTYTGAQCDALRADVAAIHASLLLAIDDLALQKAELDKAIADVTAVRTALLAAGVDLGVLRTPTVALVTDVTAVRTGSEANNTAIDAVLVALETSKILKSA